jgi:hypothetical protein
MDWYQKRRPAPGEIVSTLSIQNARSPIRAV